MSNTVFNARITAKHDTTENWNRALSFIPLQGEIIVYDDYSVVDGKKVPAIKIGDGLAYVVDLPFVAGEMQQEIIDHINNLAIHVASFDRTNWDSKVSAEIEDENLIFKI